MQAGWCLICGFGKRRELVRQGPDPVIGGLTGQAGATARFVICARCGHVYQDPMLDERDLARLGFGAEAGSGAETPAEPRLADDRVSRWLVDLIEPTVRRMTVLATAGFDRGRFLRARHAEAVLFPFKERGWLVYEEGASDQRFSLILFTQAIERVPDPIPTLRAMRSSLDEDGVICVVTPNLLDPPPAARLFGELFSGAHARLYSPGALQTILARSGFQAELVRSCQGDGLLGIIAKPVDWVQDHPFDDPAAIQQLFEVLQWPGSTDVLGWNLASLAETQPWVLPPLCRIGERNRYAICRSDRSLLALNAHLSEGPEIPIVRWGDLDGYKETPELINPKVPSCQGPTRTMTDETLVQLGLGSGELAKRLAESLDGSQHLFIWEADPVLARAILEVVDLSPLWLSKQVGLLLGEEPVVPTEHRRRLERPTLLHITDSARCWNTSVYRQILGRLDLSDSASREA